MAIVGNAWLLKVMPPGGLARLSVPDDVHRLGEALVLVGSAMDNEIADDILDPYYVDRVLLRQSIVPADVQRTQNVGILRGRIGQLTAGQLLKVDVSLRVGISRQFDLRRRFRRPRCRFRNRDRNRRALLLQQCRKIHAQNCRAGTKLAALSENISWPVRVFVDRRSCTLASPTAARRARSCRDRA